MRVAGKPVWSIIVDGVMRMYPLFTICYHLFQKSRHKAFDQIPHDQHMGPSLSCCCCCCCCCECQMLRVRIECPEFCKISIVDSESNIWGDGPFPAGNVHEISFGGGRCYLCGRTKGYFSFSELVWHMSTEDLQEGNYESV